VAAAASAITATAKQTLGSIRATSTASAGLAVATLQLDFQIHHPRQPTLRSRSCHRPWLWTALCCSLPQLRTPTKGHLVGLAANQAWRQLTIEEWLRGAGTTQITATAGGRTSPPVALTLCDYRHIEPLPPAVTRRRCRCGLGTSSWIHRSTYSLTPKLPLREFRTRPAPGPR